MSSENPTPSPAADPDLINEQAILREFLDTIDSDDSDDDVSSVYSVCSNCKLPAKKAEDLKGCSRCHITRYCSVQCQKKDWDFHRFACGLWPRSRFCESLNSLPQGPVHICYSFTSYHFPQ